MGTRCVVELWTTDGQGRGRHRVGICRHAPGRRDDECLQADLGALARQRRGRRSIRSRSQPELFDVLAISMQYSRLSKGVFDVTYASVGYLYDYRRHVRPDDAAIAKALPGIDYRHVKLDPKAHTVAFERPGMRIDLGGIAKGYAVDRGIDILKRAGFDRAMVNAGGDSRIIGDRFGKPWVVGIRDPDDRDKVVLRMPLAGRCLFHLWRLRALFRRGRGALPPHPGPADRQVAAQRCAAPRSSHRPRPAPTGCPRRYSSSAPRRGSISSTA